MVRRWMSGVYEERKKNRRRGRRDAPPGRDLGKLRGLTLRLDGRESRRRRCSGLKPEVLCLPTKEETAFAKEFEIDASDGRAATPTFGRTLLADLAGSSFRCRWLDPPLIRPGCYPNI